MSYDLNTIGSVLSVTLILQLCIVVYTLTFIWCVVLHTVTFYGLFLFDYPRDSLLCSFVTANNANPYAGITNQ